VGRIWTGFTEDYIECSAGATGAAGTGDYTLVVLIKPNGTAFGAGVSLLHSSAIARQIIFDTGKWYGAGDFSGFGTVVSGDWQVVGQSKAAGTSVYRWHYWDYTLGGAKTHADGTGTHTDPGAVDDVRLGDGDNKGKQTSAVIAVWNRVLSDAEFESLCTANLSDWAALAPDALWPLNQASGSDPVSDVTDNGADQIAISGTIDTDTDPPGFDYTLTTPKSLSDSGGGSDSLAVVAAPSLSDTGSAADALTVTVAANLTDSGAAAEGLSNGAANATSAAAVSAGRSSTATTATGRAATSTVGQTATSTPNVSDG
jgi:hypothetical protein